MSRILVIFTGGTIGSVANNEIIAPDSRQQYELISRYQETYRSLIEFETKCPYEILSENISIPFWNKLIACLANIDYIKYDGIIITHGSDTLAYTSALIGMLYRHINIPIIIIASNKPINDKSSNGLFNFATAVDMISKKNYCGVFTVYEEVYLPTRLIPADTLCDKFSSYGGEPFYGVSEYRLKRPRKQLIIPNIELKNEILMINPYPNMNYDNISLSTRPSAVLHTLYHSGTSCTDSSNGTNYSLLTFAKKCKALDIPLYVCGAKSNDTIYESAKQFKDSGIKIITSTSDVATYIKLLIAYNQNEINTSRYIYSNVYFEKLK